MPVLLPTESLPPLARRRRALGISQGAFARMLGVTAGYYVHIDRGDRPYPPRLAERANIVLAELEDGAYRAQKRLQLVEAAPAGRVA